MPHSARCNGSRELLAELAIGIADGPEHSRALAHVAECTECQIELERQSAVADELLTLAAEEEPPLGFESRVLRAIQPEPAPTRGRVPLLRWLVPAVAAAIAVALTAGAMFVGYRDERRVADHYRATLSQAHGEYFGAVRLEDAAGRPGGVVFRYRGTPSWLVISVAPDRARIASADVVDARGRRIPLRSFRLVDGVWGGPVPVALGNVAAVELLRPDGRTELSAQLGNLSGAPAG